MYLNHLHFGAENPKETQDFYKEYFGFCFHMQLGETTVLKNEFNFLLAIDSVATRTVQAISNLHFGFCLNDPSAVHTLFLQMKSNLVPFHQELKERSSNAVNFYCLDPVQNIVEVGWYRSLSSTHSA